MSGDVRGLQATAEAPRKQPARRLPWYKNLAYAAIYGLFMVAVLLLAGEGSLRVLPLGAYKSAPFRQYDPVIGISLIPNQRVIHRRDCFEGEVVTNRWGMRDRDRSLQKPDGAFRIALMGDSGVEAVQVRPHEVVNIQMEQRLRQKAYRNIEVMAFGVEGVGTTQELLMYKAWVRQFHPDLVVLMFSLNDVMNNSSTLQPKAYGMHTWYAPYYDLGQNGELIFRPVPHRRWNGLRSFLERHSLLLYYVERAWLRVDLAAYEYKWQGLPIEMAVYEDDPVDPEWKQAWQVTGRVLKLMDDTVTQDGTRFIVLVWPGLTDIGSDWRDWMVQRFGKIPHSFNPQKPEEHLRQIASQTGVPLDFLAPYMDAYRADHQLRWPYFSFSCDLHSTAMGNNVYAGAIIQQLEQHRLLPATASVQ
jgi:hypothetical protein